MVIELCGEPRIERGALFCWEYAFLTLIKYGKSHYETPQYVQRYYISVSPPVPVYRAIGVTRIGLGGRMENSRTKLLLCVISF